MIREIELQNWRSHGQSKLEFRQGTNLLMGNMGSGKSSVLDAISFVLFGTFPALERRKLKLEHLIREKAKEAKIALVLRWNGSTYRIERSIEHTKKRAASQASIYKEGKLLDTGPTAVTRYVEQLLGVDHDLFTRAIYSEQNNVDYFLNLDPRRRKQEFDGLLGLDKFETVRSNVVSVINTLKNQRKTFEEKFDKEKLAQTKKRKQELESNLTKLRKERENMKKQIKERETEKEKAEKEFQFLRRKKEEYDKALQSHTRKESKWEQLQQEVKDFDEKEIVSLKQNYAEIEKERMQLHTQKKIVETRWYNAGQQKARLETQQKEIKKKIEEHEKSKEAWKQLAAGKTLDDLYKGLEEVEKALLETQTQEKTIAKELEQLDEWQKELTVDLTACPLCEQPLSTDAIKHVHKEKEKKKTEKENEKEKLLEQVQKLQDAQIKEKERLQQAEQLWKQIEEGKKYQEEIPRWKEKERAVQEEWEKIKTEKETLEEKWEKTSKEHEQKKWQLKEAEKQLAKKHEMNRLGKELEKDKIILQKSKVEETELEKRRKTLEEVRIVYEKLLLELKSHAQQEHSLAETYELLNEESNRMEQIEKETQRLAKLEEQLISYRQAVLETQAMLRNSLIEAINAALNEIWKIFYPYGNYKELRMRVDEKDYVFEVLEDQWIPLETVASGGERSCAALTLRVALATVLTPNLSWLILDEPTHNLDKQAVELLSQTLQFKVPEVVKQSFVITHEESLMGSDFASSYKLKRNKEGLGSTIVEKI